MNLKLFLLLYLSTITVGDYTCSDTDCYDCVDNVCHLSCQGKSCRSCPSGNCCNGTNCNVCIASICCSTAKCNRCVNRQRLSCPDTISSILCSTAVAEKCDLNTEDQVSDHGNLNCIHHNITTVIKLQNLINHTNVVDLPIELNITNANDVMLNKTRILLKSLKRRERKCCSIVHPQECHKAPLLPREVCFTRRHKECSELCDNATNLLIKTDRTKQCITIAVHPYFYCGYYSIEDCSSCFNCTKLSNTECLEGPTCTKTCRSSILPRKFYNAPYYMNANNGEPADRKSVV